MTRLSFLLLAMPLLVAAQTPYAPLKRADLPALAYELSLYPDGADHDPVIPPPQEVLGFAVGEQAATSAQVDDYARLLARVSERVQVVEYGRSFEDRPLVYLVISSPENLARSEDIQQGMAKLADPRGLDAGERDRLTGELPGVAWLGYSIHGNESSGSDSALAVMYHLAADRSARTAELLDDLVVIVDPNMNPDGRERFMNALDQNRGRHPNVDDQSLLHTGYWPYGRGNHYLFDLNRDWIYARLPETRGRIPHVLRWRPLLLVDAHEMGAQDTYMFSPAREPHNLHLPPYRQSMGQVFADGKARRFDRLGYPYYTGEWHEDWYPGYTDAWASLRGALGVLYEQARLAEDGVQRQTHLISYKQSVHHQVLASFADLETLKRERQSMLEQFANDRASVVSPGGPYGNRSFVVLPTDNHGRMKDLLDLLAVQQFEVHRLTREVQVSRATDQLGRELSNHTLPAGSLVLRNRQPDGRLLAAMFEFDPQMSTTALTNERERVLREGRSTIYDTTGWNITMMFGLEALSVPEHLDNRLEPVDPAAELQAPAFPAVDNTIALAVSGADDRANALAGRLMQRGLTVRGSSRASRLDGVDLPIGSIAITLDDNRNTPDWRSQVRVVAADLGVAVHAIRHGRAPGELADLGGRQWRALESPRIALLTRGSSNMLDYGAVWYLLDHRLGLRHSQLDEDRAAAMDLRRYNVIYLPDRRTWGGGGPLSQALIDRLADWVRAGGTLIAAGGSVGSLVSAEDPLVRVRTLDQVIGEDLTPYQDALYREWLAGNQPLPEDIWSHEGSGNTMPWAGMPSLPLEDERKRRDQWLGQFMPSGALVANRVDVDHWLNAGGHDYLTALFSNSPILMAQPPVQAPLRIGVYDQSEDAESALVGWAPVPAGQALRVRAAGLLWPEARERIASAAWMTRESVGSGQVILFAHPPAFRGAQLGAMRVLENALILGPGMGASQPIELP